MVLSTNQTSTQTGVSLLQYEDAFNKLGNRTIYNKHGNIVSKAPNYDPLPVSGKRRTKAKHNPHYHGWDNPMYDNDSTDDDEPNQHKFDDADISDSDYSSSDDELEGEPLDEITQKYIDDYNGPEPLGVNMRSNGPYYTPVENQDDVWNQSLPQESFKVLTGYFEDPRTGVKFRTFENRLDGPDVTEPRYVDWNLGANNEKYRWLNGYDPNITCNPPKEHVKEIPSASDGPSYAMRALLRRGCREYENIHAAREIFKTRNDELPQPMIDDTYSNGYVGFWQAFRPMPNIPNTFRGDETCYKPKSDISGFTNTDTYRIDPKTRVSSMREGKEILSKVNLQENRDRNWTKENFDQKENIRGNSGNDPQRLQNDKKPAKNSIWVMPQNKLPQNIRELIGRNPLRIGNSEKAKNLNNTYTHKIPTRNTGVNESLETGNPHIRTNMNNKNPRGWGVQASTDLHAESQGNIRQYYDETPDYIHHANNPNMQIRRSTISIYDQRFSDKDVVGNNKHINIFTNKKTNAQHIYPPNVRNTTNNKVGAQIINKVNLPPGIQPIHNLPDYNDQIAENNHELGKQIITQKRAWFPANRQLPQTQIPNDIKGCGRKCVQYVKEHKLSDRLVRQRDCNFRQTRWQSKYHNQVIIPEGTDRSVEQLCG